MNGPIRIHWISGEVTDIPGYTAAGFTRSGNLFEVVHLTGKRDVANRELIHHVEFQVASDRPPIEAPPNWPPDLPWPPEMPPAIPKEK